MISDRDLTAALHGLFFLSFLICFPPPLHLASREVKKAKSAMDIWLVFLEQMKTL